MLQGFGKPLKEIGASAITLSEIYRVLITGAAMSTYYVHKEPVLDRKRCLFGNELSFRRGASIQGGQKWPALSVDDDVVGAVSSEGGFERLAGNKRTFLNLDVGVMKGDMLALLPKNSVFQVPERDALDKEILLKAAMLKSSRIRLPSTTHHPAAASRRSIGSPTSCE